MLLKKLWKLNRKSFVSFCALLSSEHTHAQPTNKTYVFANESINEAFHVSIMCLCYKCANKCVGGTKIKRSKMTMIT